MDLFDPLWQVAPSVSLLWLLLLATILCTIAVGCCRSIAFLRRQRSGQLRLIKTLRIQHMLQRLGISPGRYLRKESPQRVELHLLRCHRCPNPQSCDAFLHGDTSRHPNRFCPNFNELAELTPDPEQAHSPDFPTINPEDRF